MDMFKIKNVWKLQILWVVLVLSGNVYCESSVSPTTNTANFLQDLAAKNPGYTFEFKLPINVYDKNIVLDIKIPKNLQLKNESVGNPHLMQFGDKNTLLTITHQTGGKFQATQSLDNIIKAMQARSQVTILDHADKSYPGCVDGYRMVKLHNTKNNTNDIVYIYAASGPYDSASVLYAMRVPDDKTLDAMVSMLKDSFNANVHLVDKPKLQVN